MSREMTDAAFALILKPATRKLTLLVLADCHNHLSGRCNPSIKYLAEHTGLNRKSVIESLADLEYRGLISVVRGHSNYYKLHLGQEPKVSTEIGTNPEINLGTENGTCLVPKTGLTRYRKRDTNRERTGKEPFMPNPAIKPSLTLLTPAWTSGCCSCSELPPFTAAALAGGRGVLLHSGKSNAMVLGPTPGMDLDLEV